VIQVPVPVVLPTVVHPPPAPAPLPPPPVPPPAPAPVEAPRVTAPPPPPPPAAGVPAHNPDELYIAELRRHLESVKRYPTSREARQTRPQGTVRLWIELDRAGQLLGSGVETSAGTLLIDNEALRTVRNARFPAFPPDAFAGKNSFRFVIPIEYVAPGN